jgi:pyruvate ferredoxin oxidoreductase alpha subunit
MLAALAVVVSLDAVLTHASERVDVLADERMRQVLELIPDVSADFDRQFGRESGGLLRPYRAADAELIIVALGSVLGTVKDTIDELRKTASGRGARHHQLRPFPVQSVRAVLAQLLLSLVRPG